MEIDDKAIDKQEEEHSDAYTRTHDKIGAVNYRRLSAMDITVLRRNKNRFVMGFSKEFADSVEADPTVMVTLVPDILQFVWLFMASEADYIKAVQDNDFYLEQTIKLGMKMDYDELTQLIPDLQRIVNETGKVTVKKAPVDKREKIGQKKTTN